MSYFCDQINDFAKNPGANKAPQQNSRRIPSGEGPLSGDKTEPPQGPGDDQLKDGLAFRGVIETHETLVKSFSPEAGLINPIDFKELVFGLFNHAAITAEVKSCWDLFVVKFVDEVLNVAFFASPSCAGAA